MPDNIELGGERIAPGRRQSILLPLPELYSHSPVSMPVHVVNGRRDGPVLFVSAAVHGDELNGVEIIRRLLHSPQVKSIRGALFAVPIVNVYGFVSRSRYLPDRRDLNRSFPGSDHGSMASRLANTFMKEIVTQCSHGIDLHTGAIGRENLPQIRAKVVDAPQTEGMARAFATPVILNSEIRDGSLRQAVAEHNIPVLVYEAGEALRFDEISIRAGLKGIIGVMRHIGMLAPRKKRKKEPAEPLIARSSRWVRTPQSGILRSIAPLGSRVAPGDIIGRVADPFGMNEVEILATDSGIIIGKTNLPLVHEGEALFNVAHFKKPGAAAESVEAFKDEHDPFNGGDDDDEEPVIT